MSTADVDDTETYDETYLTDNGWSTADSGVTYTQAGTYGTATFTVASGVVGYALDDALAATQALDDGDEVTETFTIQVTDGDATNTADAVFTINGSNDAPTITAGAAGNE